MILKLLFFAFLILIVAFIFWLIMAHVKIKWKTFFHKGFAPKRGDFGLYVYDGKQGKGKTYSLVEYLLDHRNSIEVFCNIKGIKNLDYKFFTGFDELIQIKEALDNDTLIYDKEKQLVIVYDEIFTELLKNSRLSKPVLDFLCQMRKRKIIFLTTAQEWAEIPLTFRRFCRYEIKCNMINFLGLGILIKRFGDAENMKWDEEMQEHTCPLTETTVTHCRKFIADSYDTFLRISSVAVPTEQPQEIVKNKFTTTEVSSLKDNIDRGFWDDLKDNDVVYEVNAKEQSDCGSDYVTAISNHWGS